MGLNLINDNEIDCQLEEVAKKNIFQRIRLIILFSLFLLLVFLLAKNDFKLTFEKENSLELICGPKNTLDTSADDNEARQEKLNRAIKINQEKFATINGFQKIYADEEAIGYQKHPVWVAKVIFLKEDKNQKKIPEQLCGFPLIILYK